MEPNMGACLIYCPVYILQCYPQLHVSSFKKVPNEAHRIQGICLEVPGIYAPSIHGAN